MRVGYAVDLLESLFERLKKQEKILIFIVCNCGLASSRGVDRSDVF